MAFLYLSDERIDALFDENQLIKIKWNNTNQNWYESKGYIFTKKNDEFFVRAKDLTPCSSANIIAICDYCGKQYETSYLTIMNGRRKIFKDACRCCNGLKLKDTTKIKRANKAFEKLYNACQKFGYKLLTKKEEFTTVNMQVKFECPKHGEQTMMLDNLVRGHECIYCSYEKRGKNLRHSIKNIIDTINDTNNVLLNPQDYVDTFTRNLNIRCQCGNIYTTSFSNFEKHGVNRCHICAQNESSGELKIRKFLESKNIDFIQEKRFDDCRDKKPLPFDFYLPNLDFCIEFDGKQHYEPLYGEESYYQTLKHDKIKNTYCKTKNIQLLRIPYWEGNRINEILQKEIEI